MSSAAADEQTEVRRRVVVGPLWWGERHRGQRVVGTADHGDAAPVTWRTDDTPVAAARPSMSATIRFEVVHSGSQ